MKKITLIILTFIISTLCMTSCSAAEPQNVSASGFTLTMKIGEPVMTVNDVKKEIDPGRSTTPVIINERILVPIRYSLGIRYAECFNRSRQRYNNTYNRQHNCICK